VSYRQRACQTPSKWVQLQPWTPFICLRTAFKLLNKSFRTPNIRFFSFHIIYYRCFLITYSTNLVSGYCRWRSAGKCLRLDLIMPFWDSVLTLPCIYRWKSQERGESGVLTFGPRIPHWGQSATSLTCSDEHRTPALHLARLCCRLWHPEHLCIIVH
jgi:hypothetical protein